MAQRTRMYSKKVLIPVSERTRLLLEKLAVAEGREMTSVARRCLHIGLYGQPNEPGAETEIVINEKEG